MKQIPLYDPLPSPPVPPELARRSYQDEAQQLEAEAHKFFALPDELGVLAVDRATHGLGHCFHMLSKLMPRGRCIDVVTPIRTYRAAIDAAIVGGFPTCSHKSECICGDVPGLAINASRSITVPTTLGGTMPKPGLMQSGCAVVYDCAHTCHPLMFENVTFRDTHFAVLSFYPTKPAGAFGGGLVIGAKRFLATMRKHIYPTDITHVCSFSYPQTVQSWGMRYRLKHYDLNRQKILREYMKHLIEMIHERTGAWPVFPYKGLGVISPHLLAYIRTPRLAEACLRADLETGDHYPSVAKNIPGRQHITIPFHTPEVQDRLEKVL